jgi:hypothetical protein
MKLLRILFSIALLVFQVAPTIAGINNPGSGSGSVVVTSNSQLNPDGSIFVNVLKQGQAWVCTTGGAHAQPSDLSTTGYPISTSACMAAGHGLEVPSITTSSQFERPGNWVQLGSGLGAGFIFDSFSATSASPGASACSGTRSGGGNITCTNSSCTQPTGQISGQTLTITVASSCPLLLYQAITNGSTFTNQFGVPTMIIGMSGSANCVSCTGTGGTGTYLINWSQTVASGSMIQGLYNEVTITAGTENTTGYAAWSFGVNATDATNPVANMALVHKSDLLAYAQGQLTNPLFKLRVQQANFAILRNQTLDNPNVGNRTTWSTRRPPAYYSYTAPEMRASLFACSYGLYNGTTPCQTTYALNGSSNDYSVNLGAALPVDKQTVCVQWSTNTTNTTNTFSIDNGTTKHAVIAYHGGNLGIGNISAGHMEGLVYDATLQEWVSTVVSGISDSCLNNFGSAEAFVEVNQEIGTTPWITEPYLAADPITDYMLQYAKYFQGFTWSHTPIFEIPDEPWNCAGQGVGPYASLKSGVYVAADTTWSANASGHTNCGEGDMENWAGKAASLLGQVLRNVSSSYVALVGTQTVGNAGSLWNAELLSNSYVGQNPSNIPTQNGCAGAAAIQTSCPTPFTQTAAYKAMAGATSAAAGITIANYWGLTLQQGTTADNMTEVSEAYCYFFQSGGCASQSSVMTTYMATQSITNAGTVPSIVTLWSNWHNFANTCAGGASCSPMSVYNYEGTYSVGSVGSDETSPVTAATNASTAVLTISPNGCVAGQTVALSSLVGGTWSTAAGSYTVQSAAAGTCTINLNSTSLGTLSSATLTYAASADYVNYLRINSWLSPDLATDTTLLYNTIASTTGTSACSPSQCSYLPSQFLIDGSTLGYGAVVGNVPWYVWSPDMYGYYAVATCTACTAASGSLTLGGTVQGIFVSGLTIVGGQISGVTITGACTQTGALPAGANSGDVCPISSASTVSSSSIAGTIAPATNQAGNSTTSPVTQWGAICAWNKNGPQCNGGWLLKRDIDPTSNDNDPMWLDKAA